MKQFVIIIVFLAVFSCGEKATVVKKRVLKSRAPMTFFGKAKIGLGESKKQVVSKLLKVASDYKVTIAESHLRVALSSSTNSFIKFKFNGKQELTNVSFVCLAENPKLKKIIQNLNKRRLDLCKKGREPYDLGFLYISHESLGSSYKFHDSGFLNLRLTFHSPGNQQEIMPKGVQVRLFKKVDLRYDSTREAVKKALQKLSDKREIVYKNDKILVYFSSAKKSFFKLLFTKKGFLYRVVTDYYAGKKQLEKMEMILSRNGLLRENRTSDFYFVTVPPKGFFNMRSHYSAKPQRISCIIE